jgi:hypothetical protein
MARNNRSSTDALAEGIVFGMLALLWALVAGIVALFVKSTQTPPEVQARQLAQAAAWGSQVESVTCSRCGAFNELGQQRCITCGSDAIAADLTQEKRQASKPKDNTIILLIFFVVGLLCFATFICGLANS